MKKAVFFDLDGTLLPMDFDKFMSLYFSNMMQYFKGSLDVSLLPKAIMAGTYEMVKDTSDRTNESVFMDFFGTYYNVKSEEYMERFDTFYKTIFDDVQVATWQSKAMQEVVEHLKSKKIDIIIATNPLFPIEANYRRIKWAGLNIEDFKHITSLEVNTKCKPTPHFYEEVLKQTGYQPEDVLMVGNDYIEDGVASTLGIETYIVTDCAMNKEKSTFDIDHESSMDDFLKYIKKTY